MFINEEDKTNKEIIKEILNNPILSDEAKTRAIQALKKKEPLSEGLEEGEILLNEEI